jgi:hypothetical protein
LEIQRLKLHRNCARTEISAEHLFAIAEVVSIGNFDPNRFSAQQEEKNGVGVTLPPSI